MIKKIVFLYSLLFILFSAFSYLFVDTNVIYLKSIFSDFAYTNRLLTTVIFFLFVSAFFCCYILILNYSNTVKFDGIKKYLILPLFGIFAYPAALSFDIFNYIATAKVAFHYFENPYIVMPVEFIGDPMLLFTRAANKIALYGPVWIFLTSIPFYLSFGNYLLSIVLFKILVSSFFFGVVFLIWKITKSMYSVLYFATSPLVLIETFINGHNDVVMIFFALLSLHLLKSKKTGFALLFLLASILIKYATLFLIPVYVYYFWKKNSKKDVNWNTIYFYSFLLMFFVFILSPIREELYTWYAIWIIPFVSLVQNKTIRLYVIIFTFGLLLRYIPYMLLGTYLMPTPVIRNFLTFIPLILFIIFNTIKNRKLTL